MKFMVTVWLVPMYSTFSISTITLCLSYFRAQRSHPLPLRILNVFKRYELHTDCLTVSAAGFEISFRDGSLKHDTAGAS
jgi:hypothetical protein